ncbi:MAG: hypothetical protein LBE78_12265 [Burkholderiaceae bacterium]|jgi:hypothetical protein|nr:hypothetical protein [Burkholderiaceae bacterium]
MTNHQTGHAPQAHSALFSTPTALILDHRLTPLERNGWQVLRMLRATDGLSQLASMGQLRRYLTSTPLGQRAGYETAWRVLTVLRLTGWISLAGQHCDPMTGDVLSALYQVHDSALNFEQACTLDASLPQLLQASVGHENNQVDRIAIHIQENLARAPVVAAGEAEQRRHDDDGPPAPKPIQPANQSVPCDTANEPSVSPQTATAHQTTDTQASTYTYPYLYKNIRTTYLAHAHAHENEASYPQRLASSASSERGNANSVSDSALSLLTLPPCLNNAKADQKRDVRIALRRLPLQQRQDVLDELQARSQGGSIRNIVSYFFGLIRRVFRGEFHLWAGRKPEQAATMPATAPQTAPRPLQAASTASANSTAPRARTRPPLEPKPASPEVARAHLDEIRRRLSMPVHVGDALAQVMQAKKWQIRPA